MTDNPFALEAMEILEGIRPWVEIESPTTEPDAVNRLVDLVEGEFETIGHPRLWNLATLGYRITSWLAIEALLRIAELVEVPVYIIGFLGVSLGTSLPELLVDVTALRQGRRDLAVGDVFGSSLVDATLSIGIGPLVAPVAVSADLALTGGVGALGAAGVVTLLLGTLRRHNRITGTGLLLLYAALYMILLNAF